MARFVLSELSNVARLSSLFPQPACLAHPASPPDTGDGAPDRAFVQGRPGPARARLCQIKHTGNVSKALKKEPASGTRRGPRRFFPSSAPQHRLLIFKSPAIAWCGFKSWGAILPDDDSADVNGILIMPSATSETSPPRLLLFAAAGRALKCGPDRS